MPTEALPPADSRGHYAAAQLIEGDPDAAHPHPAHPVSPRRLRARARDVGRALDRHQSGG